MGRKALIVVDVQNDFCPGGALAVPRGDEVVAPLNILMAKAEQAGDLIVVSNDWHPKNSDHFKKWSVHCVQNTYGAKLHPLLRVPSGTIHIYKGIAARGDEKEVDGYSVFDGMTTGCRTLDAILAELGIRELIIGGLATDYCVKKTVLDALRLGYIVDVQLYACRGVDEQTTAEARKLMYNAGARFTQTP